MNKKGYILLHNKQAIQKMKSSLKYRLTNLSYILIPLCSIFLMTSACGDIAMRPEGMEFCTVVNNSNKIVSVVISGREFPDTLYPLGYGMNEYAPHETSSFYISGHRDYWKSRDQYLNEFPVIQVFIVDAKTLLEQKEVYIREHHLILRRYELTRKWLEQHNWTVVYP